MCQDKVKRKLYRSKGHGLKLARVIASGNLHNEKILSENILLYENNC